MFTRLTDCLSALHPKEGTPKELKNLCSKVQQAVIGTSAARGVREIPQITTQNKYTQNMDAYTAPSCLLAVVSLVSPLFLSAAS